MSSRGGSSRRGNAPPSAAAAAKSSGLAAEAQEMENKLLELRKAMQEMKTTREQRIKNADTGTYWRNAAPTSAGGPRSTPSAGGRNSKVSTPLPPLLSQQQGLAGTTQQGSLQGTPRSTYGRLHGPSDMPHISAAGRAAEARLQQQLQPPQQLQPQQQPQQLPQHLLQQQQRGGFGGAGGTGPANHEEPSTLQQGAFNESESHASFLDALNEWRTANRAAKKQPQQPQQPQQHHLQPQHQQQQPSVSSSSSHDRDGPEINIVSSRASLSRQQDAAGVQTDQPRPLPHRPTSAARLQQPHQQQHQQHQQQHQEQAPPSYFNRLLINSASRQAGQLAASGSFGSAGHGTLSAAAAAAVGAAPGYSSFSAAQGLATSTSLPFPGAGITAQQQQQQQGGGPQRVFSGLLPPLGPGGLDPANHASSASAAVYAVEAAMSVAVPPPGQQGAGGFGGSSAPVRHKGLDILEELERLEVQQHRAALAYDSDEEWAALLSPRQHGPLGMASRRAGQQQGQQQELPVVTTQHGAVGLTKGARLPDAILLPQPDSDPED